MEFVHTAGDALLGVCSTVALTVTTVTEWTSYILHANYVFVTNLYTSLCYVLTLFFTVLDSVLQAIFTVLVYFFDFLSEVYACVCALLVLLWRICVLVFKVLCFVVTGVETLALGLWNGGVLTYKTLQQSAMDVVETCESTTDYFSMLVQDCVVYVCGVFTAIGGFCTWIVRGVWLGLGYLPATMANLPNHLWQWLERMWMQSTMSVHVALNSITRETYIGISVCLLLYVMLPKVLLTLHRRGLTSFSLWRLGNSRQQPRSTTRMAFDPGFESDIDDEDDFDNPNSEDGDDGNSDGGGGGGDSDAQTELTLSDDDEENSAGSESDVSLNSQTFSSEESDQEIDVQLPETSGRRSRLSRSCTPSQNLSKDMDHGDFERELERERDKRKCVVCQDANKSVLILPCKHMCLCITCANQIVRSRFGERRNCPLCRGRIERVMDVFV